MQVGFLGAADDEQIDREIDLAAGLRLGEHHQSRVRGDLADSGVVPGIHLPSHRYAGGDVGPDREAVVANVDLVAVEDSDRDIDGVHLDPWGNVSEYVVLKKHPGSAVWLTGKEYEIIPAEDMVHLFKQLRPGQHRGLPEIMPALPLFAQLRRFTLAVLSAAEAVADNALVLQTDGSASDEDDRSETDPDPLDTIELERGVMTALPYGWKLGQIQAEQPSTTYEMFKHEIINEMARCFSMPFNIAAGNSSNYNYASGRLDHQTFFKAVFNDQRFTERRGLDPILRAWLSEYLRGRTGRFRDVPIGQLPPRRWHWDGWEHVDPLKEASAEEKRLKNNSTTYAEVGAERVPKAVIGLHDRRRPHPLHRLEKRHVQTGVKMSQADDSHVKVLSHIAPL